VVRPQLRGEHYDEEQLDMADLPRGSSSEDEDEDEGGDGMYSDGSEDSDGGSRRGRGTGRAQGGGGRGAHIAMQRGNMRTLGSNQATAVKVLPAVSRHSKRGAGAGGAGSRAKAPVRAKAISHV
jgi:hypothetical protein